MKNKFLTALKVANVALAIYFIIAQDVPMALICILNHEGMEQSDRISKLEEQAWAKK